MTSRHMEEVFFERLLLRGRHNKPLLFVPSTWHKFYTGCSSLCNPSYGTCTKDTLHPVRCRRTGNLTCVLHFMNYEEYKAAFLYLFKIIMPHGCVWSTQQIPIFYFQLTITWKIMTLTNIFLDKSHNGS